jgi:hypothetical protein
MRLSLPLLLALALFVSLWHPGPPARAQGRIYEGPIVDTHAHLEADGGVTIEGLMALYDQTGVRGAWVAGLPWMLATRAWEV